MLVQLDVQYTYKKHLIGRRFSKSLRHFHQITYLSSLFGDTHVCSHDVYVERITYGSSLGDSRIAISFVYGDPFCEFHMISLKQEIVTIPELEQYRWEKITSVKATLVEDSVSCNVSHCRCIGHAPCPLYARLPKSSFFKSRFANHPPL